MLYEVITYRSNGNEKGNGQNTRNTANISDILPQITVLLENIAERQKRVAIAPERRAEAAEHIAESLKLLLGNRIAVSPEYGEILPAATEQAIATDHTPAFPARSENAPAAGAVADRDSVIRIIHTMRTDGATYADIAAHLDSLNILTFSGKRNNFV